VIQFHKKFRSSNDMTINRKVLRT